MLAAVALGEGVAPTARRCEDGYRVAEIVDAIRRSAKEGATENVTFRTLFAEKSVPGGSAPR